MATIVCIILLVTIGAMWSYISIQTLRQAYATHFFSNLTLNHVESIKFFSSQHEIVYTKAEKLSNLISKCMPSEPHGEGDIAVELWKKLEPGEK